MDQNAWKTLLHRQPETYKYNYGHVLIVGGSETMTGAAVLAARAALRVGAGLVTVASTTTATTLIDRDIEEVMTLSLPVWEKETECLKAIQTFIQERHVSTIIIGPGLTHDADGVIRKLLLLVALPIVIDAESFTALADHLAILQSATDINKHIILTPHPGEYARMIHGSIQYKTSDIVASIKAFAKQYDVTLVFKQHHTLVVNAKGKLFKNTTGNPGLATAGSGDVLAGIIAGIAAQKNITTYQAATMAVYLHGLAADIAVKSKTEPGMIASDIIEALPHALQLLDN